MRKCVLFDFDGTMAESRTLAVELYNDLAEKYRYERINQRDIEALSKLSIKGRLKVLGVPFYKLPALVMEMKRNYVNSIDSLKIVEGLPSLISELRNSGYKLYILSSNSRHIIEKFLFNHQITGFQNIYCARNIFGKNKKIDQFIKKHQIKRQEAIYIGDELRDIIACKQSGIPMIAVTWGYDSSELLSHGQPDFLVNRPEEILSLVHQNLKGGSV